ncbi:alcohol dehydrogenase [Desulfitispora alkaliphila]|uniref:iron-containing alcohol dehydrogenase family protein n=1 Tax=Desulfitispora alkaliphila TaxID=622674 RepID=UPI003D1DB769
MEHIQYFMPTKILYGENMVLNNSNLFKQYGNKALIVTGKTSAKKNGSLDHVTEALEQANIPYFLFDEVEENPSVKTVEKASRIGISENVNMIIGIGGGSPIDAAKAIGVLIKNPEATKEDLFLKKQLESIPLIAIPTTAGTGTETTPYAILTDYEQKTKRNFSSKVFPEVAILDPQYFKTMPEHVLLHTAVDALSHLVEGYLTVKANLLSDLLAEQGLKIWGEAIQGIRQLSLTGADWQRLIMASTIGGMVIAQTGTSLPHGMGYHLTYFKGIPHGKANGVLMVPYLNLHPNKEKIQNILNLLKMNDLEMLNEFLMELLGEKVNLSEEEMEEFALGMVSNQSKLANHPAAVTKAEIKAMYQAL